MVNLLNRFGLIRFGLCFVVVVVVTLIFLRRASYALIVVKKWNFFGHFMISTMTAVLFSLCRFEWSNPNGFMIIIMHGCCFDIYIFGIYSSYNGNTNMRPRIYFFLILYFQNYCIIQAHIVIVIRFICIRLLFLDIIALCQYKN